MCRSPCMKLKPVSQHSGNPAKALREVKLFQNETREALWQLQTHCGRWLINKHLTNPLRDSEECAPTGKVPPPPVLYLRYQEQVVFFSLSPSPGGKVRLTWTTAPAGTSWLILRPPLPSSSSPLHIHTHLQHHPAATHKCTHAPTWIPCHSCIASGRRRATGELLRNKGWVSRAVGLQ